MEETGPQILARRAWPWWVAVPVGILLGPFFGIYLFLVVFPLIMMAAIVAMLTVIWSYFQSRGFSRRMAVRRRTATWREVQSHLVAKPGTLIVDYQSFGCTDSHVWWVPGPIEFDFFHDWEPDSRARLVETYVWGSADAKIKELGSRFPMLTAGRTMPTRLASSEATTLEPWPEDRERKA